MAWPTLLCAAGVIIHWWWLQQDETPLFWDTARHGINALATHDTLFNPALPLSYRVAQAYFGPEAYYPPLYYAVAALFVQALGRTADAVAATGTLFFVIMTWAVCFAARRVGGRAAASLAPLLTLAAPMLFDFAHQVMLDFALTAWVAVGLALLVQRPLASVERSVGLGLTFAAGVLTKWTYPAFVVLPLLDEFVQEVRGRRGGSPPPWKAVGNALIALLIPVLLCQPWLSARWSDLRGTSESSTHVPGFSGSLLDGLPQRVFQQTAFLHQFQLDGFLVIVLALCALLWPRLSTAQAGRPLWLCLASSLLTWGVFGRHADARYAMPQLAAVVPLVACWPAVMAAWRGESWRQPCAAAVALWSAFVVVNLMLAPELFAHPWLQAMRVPPQRGYHAGPPADAGPAQSMEKVMDVIRASGRPQHAWFVGDSNEPGIEPFAMAFLAARDNVVLGRDNPAFVIDYSPEAWATAPHPETCLERITEFPTLQQGARSVVRLVHRFANWEEACRDKAQLSLAQSFAWVGRDTYQLLRVASAGELVAVLRMQGTDIAGIVIQGPLELVVRGPADELSLWAKGAVAATVEPLTEAQLGAGHLAIDLGLDSVHVEDGPLPGLRNVFAGGVAKRWVLYGPFVHLDKGGYAARVTLLPTRPLSGREVVKLIVAGPGQNHAQVDVEGDGAVMTSGRACTIQTPFTLSRRTPGMEVKVVLQDLQTGQEIRVVRKELVVPSVTVLETFLSANPLRPLNRHFFRVVGVGREDPTQAPACNVAGDH
ncbi:MAG: hypothetical protein AB2A00_32055 [Myxococcota bacterium]